MFLSSITLTLNWHSDICSWNALKPAGQSDQRWHTENTLRSSDDCILTRRNFLFPSNSSYRCTFCTQSLSLHVLYINLVLQCYLPDFFQFPGAYAHGRRVKCDTNLHADNDFEWDYTQLIDGRAVAPETTLGDVIWLSRYQTLKHIPVVNLPKWAFHRRYPASTGLDW